MSFSRAWRATSRRSGSKAEMTIASGVSSMMRSTPVAASSARMLRPSRPMMRPFRSSEGSSTTDDRRLDDRVGGQPLDRHPDDPAGLLGGLLVGLLLDPPDQPGRLEAGLVLDGLDEVALGVDGRQARNLLEPLALLVDDGLDLGFLVLEPLLLVRDRLLLAGVFLFLALLLGELSVEVLFLLLDPLLEGRRSPGGAPGPSCRTQPSRRGPSPWPRCPPRGPGPRPGAWPRRGPSRPRCEFQPARSAPCGEAARRRRRSRPRPPRRPPRSPSRSMCSFRPPTKSPGAPRDARRLHDGPEATLPTRFMHG